MLIAESENSFFFSPYKIQFLFHYNNHQYYCYLLFDKILIFIRQLMTHIIVVDYLFHMKGDFYYRIIFLVIILFQMKD